MLLKFFIILFIFFSSISYGLSRRPPEELHSEKATKIKSPFFWEVEKEGKVSYILGTIHYGISVHELLCSEVILEKLHNSDLLLTERLQAGVMTLPQKIDQIQKDILPGENERLLSPELFLSNNAHFEQLSPASREFILQKNLPRNLSYFGFLAGLQIMCVKEIVGIDITISMD